MLTNGFRFSPAPARTDSFTRSIPIANKRHAEARSRGNSPPDKRIRVTEEASRQGAVCDQFPGPPTYTLIYLNSGRISVHPDQGKDLVLAWQTMLS
jgi:hypothetical protein